jgi:hypothetical protein
MLRLPTISKARIAKAKALHDEIIRLAVERETARCIAIVEQAVADDSVTTDAAAIIFIREGILRDENPDVYFQPPLRPLVQTLRDGVRQVAERRKLETTNA